MLRLTGRMADGLLVSYNYAPPAQLHDLNRRIDEGAEDAGRAPSEIRRGYNVMGVLDVGRDDTAPAGVDDDYLTGPVQDWVKTIVDWYDTYRQDMFIFWPVAGNELVQIEAFATQVVPNVKEALS